MLGWAIHYLKVFLATLTVFGFLFGIGYISFTMPQVHEAALRGHLDANTVHIVYVSPDTQNIWTGTGFQIKSRSNKFIITNRHVCLDATELFVDFNGIRTKLKVLAVSKKVDLCLISPHKDLDGIEIAENSTIGQRLYTISYAGNAAVKQFFKGELSGFSDRLSLVVDATKYLSVEKCREFHGTIQRTQINNKIMNKCIYNRTHGVTTLTTYKGSSGSPVINSSFRVVGVIFIKYPHFKAGIVTLSDLSDFLTEYQGDK